MFHPKANVLERPEVNSRSATSSETASSWEGICDTRKTDPFFRGLDTTLRTEREIRARALDMLHTLENEPWRVGSPAAQLVEMTSAFRIYIESYVRSCQEVARAEAWEIMQ
jgi:hypothetical protein